MDYPKRLIEVDLPIKRISAHARREKSIRHGHISTLHIWWARRPLAACRAVICAALWPDPADENCPQAFRDAAARLITAFAEKVYNTNALHETASKESFGQWEGIVAAKAKGIDLDPNDPAHLNKLCFALLDFIADFANWDNSTVREYLDTSRALTQAAHEALGGTPGTRPLVVDPFAGGGSIPLEALRVGADVFASDLNPVAVLLNKVVLEYIPKYGQRLADEVRKWGEWIKREAEKELAEFYPKDPDGATPIAYLWARTIQCEGPGCGAEVPLIRSLSLAKRSDRSVALQLVPRPRAKRVDFQVIVKQSGFWVNQDDPKAKIADPKFDGTVKRGSAESDAARKIAQGLGANLDALKSVVEVKGKTARLLLVSEREPFLFARPGSPQPVSRPSQPTNTLQATRRGKSKRPAKGQRSFGVNEEEGLSSQPAMQHEARPDVSPHDANSPEYTTAETVLDRIHQSMLLFARGRSDAMKRFLVDDGIGKDARFWKLAQSLSALYPPGTDEKRWVDGVLARKKGLGL
ncbi:MAG TPA: DUF1156 domain-containing protein [Isosphaeraceae bacterium]|nr:DUF1156 domain-containing protein [Isosphaeraceae bacterium]